MPDTVTAHQSIDNVTSPRKFWSVRDDGAPVKFVDMITECRHHNTVAYISLGSAIIDLDGSPTVEVAARLRFDRKTAINLHTMLGTMIAEMMRNDEKP
ncbi:hypothetical protein GAO09_25660 [Rhizobiales bacterium RZME27]|uniref:Uncharacterized protein n=1 Tax=Endobacterium cereale TaxID=2663029 RepID=A0A6A8AHW0_9HYPH|nr:hypothetical protein [Endobacterium cereale]MEB2843777.1 hypothetical protein [Endobacterium cereale]MQY49428.1 hypothetical protein [Endobacterium cereale]